jgi:hypothetical protein
MGWIAGRKTVAVAGVEFGISAGVKPCAKLWTGWRDQLVMVFEQGAAAPHTDPWEARNDFIEVISDLQRCQSQIASLPPTNAIPFPPRSG